MGPEFEPYLPVVVPPLNVQRCQHEGGTFLVTPSPEHRVQRYLANNLSQKARRTSRSEKPGKYYNPTGRLWAFGHQLSKRSRAINILPTRILVFPSLLNINVNVNTSAFINYAENEGYLYFTR
jgi:hypothetical protein